MRQVATLWTDFWPSYGSSSFDQEYLLWCAEDGAHQQKESRREQQQVNLAAPIVATSGSAGPFITGVWGGDKWDYLHDAINTPVTQNSN